MNTICFLCPTPKLNPNSYVDNPITYLLKTLDRGQYNGYVGIDKESWDKYIGVYDYDNLPNDFPQPHGGITYLNCNDSIERAPIIIIDESFDTKLGKYVVIGFDTLHCGDNYNNWDFGDVRNETINWQNAIIEWFQKKMK